MLSTEKHAIIIAASSDIGGALGMRFCDRGWPVSGTYRTFGPQVERLSVQGARMIPCDLAERESIIEACAELRHRPNWDILILGPGDTEPIGPFLDGDFEKWDDSLTVNFTAQMRIVHELLPQRNRSSGQIPVVLFFAGGGANSATVNYSPYTISKIALIKMCELLDAEIPDTKFVIIGPGWVRTKIHESTLQAGERAGTNLQRTRDRLRADDFVPMESVLDCCDWAIRAPREAVGGRNFSTQFDAWRDPQMISQLMDDPSLCKLRRHGNDRVAHPLDAQS